MSAQVVTSKAVAWRRELQHPIGRIIIVGLNTALLSKGSKDERQKLGLGKTQLKLISDETQNAFVFVLMHHPPSWITPQDERELLDRYGVRQLPQALGERLRVATNQKVDISTFPETFAPGVRLLQREKQLQELHEAFNDPGRTITFVVGPPMVGKTALIKEFLNQIGNQKPKYGDAHRVFAWSFSRSGGAASQTASSAFFANAQEFFNIPSKQRNASSGRLLAERIRAFRTILVLDGIDVLRFGSADAGHDEPPDTEIRSL